MRRLLGIGAVTLGAVGVLLCTMAVGMGWWVAVRTTAQVDRAAARLDHSLSEVDLRLGRVETRLNAVRTDLNAVRGAAETIAAENPELPRVRAEIEQLLDRLVPTFDRADALADSLRTQATILRTVADFVDHFNDEPKATVRARNAADKIDRAAESLNGLRTRVEASKSVKAVRLTHEIITLAREVAACSDRLAEGLAEARQEIADVRESTAKLRDEVVFWIYFTASANTLVWLWGGLGQLCLIGWGRRRFASG